MRNRELFARPNVSSSAIAEENRMAFLNWFGGARFDQHLDAEINVGEYAKVRQSTGIIEVTLQETPQQSQTSFIITVRHAREAAGNDFSL